MIQRLIFKFAKWFMNRGRIPHDPYYDAPTAKDMFSIEVDPLYPAVELVLRHEGGYINHISDPGGETNFGISRRAYPHLDIKNLTREEAIEIYRKDYWQRCKCDQMQGGIGLSVFDFAVNAGANRAIRTLQESLNVIVDGWIGPITLDAARNATADHIRKYAGFRMRFYRSLSTFDTFGRGWTRRTDETLQEALKLTDYEAN